MSDPGVEYSITNRCAVTIKPTGVATAYELPIAPGETIRYGTLDSFAGETVFRFTIDGQRSIVSHPDGTAVVVEGPDCGG